MLQVHVHVQVHSQQHDVDPGPLKLDTHTTAELEHAQCSPVVQFRLPSSYHLSLHPHIHYVSYKVPFLFFTMCAGAM